MWITCPRWIQGSWARGEVPSRRSGPTSRQRRSSQVNVMACLHRGEGRVVGASFTETAAAFAADHDETTTRRHDEFSLADEDARQRLCGLRHVAVGARCGQAAASVRKLLRRRPHLPRHGFATGYQIRKMPTLILASL